MLWNRIYKIKDSIDVYLVDEEYMLFYFMNTRARKRFRVNETVIKLIDEVLLVYGNVSEHRRSLPD